MHEALALHHAYQRGDLEALKALLGNPPDFPNCRGPAGVGDIILVYAIYYSPLPFVRVLLVLVALLDAEVGDGVDRDHRGQDVAAADIDPHLGGDGTFLTSTTLPLSTLRTLSFTASSPFRSCPPVGRIGRRSRAVADPPSSPGAVDTPAGPK